MRSVMLLAVACLALPQGDSAHEFRSNLPPMTGIASAPVTVEAGQAFSYTITSEDSDTYAVTSEGKETLEEVPDYHLKLVCVRMRSMKKGWKVIKRGTHNATTYWEVFGVAVGASKPTFLHDDWRVENVGERRGDPRVDRPMTMTQSVLVNAPAVADNPTR